MKLEENLMGLGQDLATHASAQIVAEYVDLVRSGEYGVALEVLCDRLDDAQEPLTRVEVNAIQSLAAEMGLDRPSIKFIRELEVAGS